MSRRSPTASRRWSPIPTCAGASGAKASGGPRSTGGRAWPRRSAASTRRSSPARPRTSRPRAATTDPRRRCATLPRTVGVLLEVENLTTEFVTRGGVVRAADGVSWDVGEGETVALVGESGCGKSVSALSIMRLVAPPAGRIVGGRVLFKGRDLLALSDEAMRQIRGREIAMIFQEPMTSLNPVLSIGRQLTEGLEIHLGITPRRARLDPIEGQPPDLTRLGAGCAFAPRCAFQVARCAVERPRLVPIGGGGHVSACWEAANLDRAVARSGAAT